MEAMGVKNYGCDDGMFVARCEPDELESREGDKHTCAYACVQAEPGTGGVGGAGQAWVGHRAPAGKRSYKDDHKLTANVSSKHMLRLPTSPFTHSPAALQVERVNHFTNVVA